jgi:hypothetical protein
LELKLVALVLVAATAASQDIVWTRLQGTSSDDRAFAIIATEGFLHVAGITAGNLVGQPNSGEIDSFATKWAPNGTVIWTRLQWTSSAELPFAMTALEGFLYVLGYTGGSLGGQPKIGAGDIFVTALAPNGTVVWTRLQGTTSFAWARA